MPVLSRKLWKNLSQEQKEKRKESQRKWYTKPENKERKAMLNKKWCLENKEKRQESWRRYREKNRAKINEKTKKWRQENRETFNTKTRARYHAQTIQQRQSTMGNALDLGNNYFNDKAYRAVKTPDTTTITLGQSPEMVSLVGDYYKFSQSVGIATLCSAK